MLHIALLVLGSALFIFGLLQAAHAPFQRWWYSTKWKNPDRKGPVDVNSEEYKNDIFHMGQMGAKMAGGGGLLVVYSLAVLGGERLLSIAGAIFVVGLVLVIIYRSVRR